MALVDGTTPLNAANLAHKSGDDTITGQWGFTKPVGTPGGFNFTENGDVEIWNAGASSPPTGWTLNGVGASVAQDSTNVKLGSFSAALTRAGADAYLAQRADQISGFPPAALWQGKPVTVGCWVRATVASRARIQINDGVATVSSAYHSGGGTFEFLTVSLLNVNVTATQLEIRLAVDTGDTTAQFDGVVCVLGTEISDFFPSGAPVPVAAGQNVAGLFGSIGQDSRNNPTTPNTQFDLTATAVRLRNASDLIVVRYNPGTITNDVALAGPAANGRDQTGAFSADSWIHFYWIWNGSTLATLSSAMAPPTGPTLPTGYTHWAYAGAVRFNATSQLLKTRIKGSWAYYEDQSVTSAISGGNATAETAVSVSSLIPPNALAYTLYMRKAGANHLDIRVVTGIDYFHTFDTIQVVGAVTLPNISQQFLYGSFHATVGAPSLDANVLAYHLANGGE